MEKILQNYRSLLENLDTFGASVVQEFGEHLKCQKGCDACCQHLSLCWVEGFSLFSALRKLPSERVDGIRRKMVQADTGEACPLLQDHGCLLYDVRPVICRTHGFPLMNEGEEGPEIHCCPYNFKKLETLPGTAVLDMEAVNISLATINVLFIEEFFAGVEKPSRERLKIAEFLSLDAEKWFIDRMVGRM